MKTTKACLLFVLMMIFAACVSQKKVEKPSDFQIPVWEWGELPAEPQVVEEPAAKPEEEEPAKIVLQPEGCVEVTVDYDLSLSHMVMFYSWSLPPVMAKSPRPNPRQKGKVLQELCWFQFEIRATPEEVQEWIEDSGDFLVADTWELYAIVKEKPELREQLDDLVALGSVFWTPAPGDVWFKSPSYMWLDTPHYFHRPLMLDFSVRYIKDVPQDSDEDSWCIERYGKSCLYMVVSRLPLYRYLAVRHK